LIEQGRSHVKEGNLPELKAVVFQLQDLIPPASFEDASRGYGSSLVG
jgi:hypothetical protein